MLLGWASDSVCSVKVKSQQNNKVISTTAGSWNWSNVNVRKCENLCVITWVYPAFPLLCCYHNRPAAAQLSTDSHWNDAATFCYLFYYKHPEPNNATKRRAWMLFMADIVLSGWSSGEGVHSGVNWGGQVITPRPSHLSWVPFYFQDGPGCPQACAFTAT